MIKLFEFFVSIDYGSPEFIVGFCAGAAVFFIGFLLLLVYSLMSVSASADRRVSAMELKGNEYGRTKR